jgi:tetratricopeptide (TPR) repeat protein
MTARALLALLLALSAASAAAQSYSFKSWAARGAREEREKDPKAAFASYSNALSLWKASDGGGAKARVLFARAALRAADGDDAGALKDLTEGLALDKKNAKAFHRRGQLRLKTGKTALAIDDFYKAVALDIGFAQAYADRARAYEAQGEKAFAREDHRHACALGVKASCARAKELAPKKPVTPAKVPKTAAPPAPKDPAEPAPAPDAPAAGPKPVEPAEARRPAAYRPRFKDCVDSLNACVEEGRSFGACVKAAPACEAKAVRGCCPAACLKAYGKSAARKSEAQSFRENFSLDAPCAVPPKNPDEDEEE